MKHYLITGGTGLIGRRLVNVLKETDAHLTILTRKDRQSDHPKITYINWQQAGWQDNVPDIDIVINLAGETLNQRWTPEAKRNIMLSRLKATQALYDLFASRSHKPSTLFNASAIGFYKPDLTRTYTELYRTQPFDFLSDVVYQWERLARQFEAFGTRVVIGRFGIVLANEGGAFPMMKLPYKLFAGGKLGSGRQWYSWIHITDLIRAILYTVHEPFAQGVFNMTAPIPERQNLFGYTIGRSINRPHYSWVPTFVLRTVLGEMSTVLVDTQKVLPNHLQAIDFNFVYPNLKVALDALTA
ncbi:uncharacterized protein ACUW9N_000968 [Staphylococcus auricularis]|uniref:TIGR01777 family oxidoreductase n=1 Tax=Staphylococcus auricularis TaxID=29379 RepID=A0AAP8TT69_9STAP|nr:TIGR01777 family oxidoreductase [Staphylococcus auricularis]MBM0868527.1 TIGR01777 family protein [Staphylococcus auricularis]MCG7341756.1 TIGR01777 family oxidoreductase [Staphylococcus auricularis]MDC6327877.1 TIGR01777 family oxidoreductase [Staphylococcus auricularis]MDN4533930.1 TIGR01777 family oxidoreductase [Staphylococcus auricularis]PNZ67560.1 TIGR01777 family protein [Staphylococcus auricularis]